MTKNKNWCACQLGDNKRYSFKLNGFFKKGLQKGDEVIENFDGKQVVYRVVTVDYDAKIYGVNYLYEIII